MADEQQQGGEDKPVRSTSRETMGMRRISSRPGGRRAPVLLTVIVVIAVAIAVLITLAPWKAKSAVGGVSAAGSAARLEGGHGADVAEPQ